MPQPIQFSRVLRFHLFAVGFICCFSLTASGDHIRELQKRAEKLETSDWGHWGANPKEYSSWTSHSNRLVPIYTFGANLDQFDGEQSLYRDQNKVQHLYGYSAPATFNAAADYCDQTDVYRLQQNALKSGKKYIILMVFDGMDWQTTQAAATFASGQSYASGRGAGLHFLDYSGVETDFGYFVSSPHNEGTETDPNAQTVVNPGGNKRGGYSAIYGGATPWARPTSDQYLLGEMRAIPHVVTDSASSATSMMAGIKTYNSAINVTPEGKQIKPLARQLQAEREFAIGVVTSVPISHATPAASYANNVSRYDYQDIARDLIGVPSVSNRREPLPGVDVLLGAGWGEDATESEKQGENFVPGNTYLTESDMQRVDIKNGGQYVVVQRQAKANGRVSLNDAAREAVVKKSRLLGYFGASGGHLPYQTADGAFDPVGEQYSAEDVSENPTLADMTLVALTHLSQNENGFWLLIEPGDVDWANHANNIDNSIGAVLSGDAAFKTITRWVELNDVWDETLLIVTADHGHYLVLDQPQELADSDASGIAE